VIPSDRTLPTRDRSDPGAATVPELLARAGDGDQRAWAELITRYTPLVRSRIARFRLQEADALDVAQTAWLRLAEHADRIRTPEHLGGWLATVVANECVRLLRNSARAVPVADDQGWRPDPADGPEQVVLRRHSVAVLAEVVGELSPRRRALVAALFAEDRPPYARIARELGVPIGGLGPTRARTLRELRLLLAERGIDAA